ncbi:hypothetical protein rerp_33980 [Rhodococcus erythropolis]|nr:hypothetical protein rerp_33980 [Rhodococcus erythropolis]
MGELIGEELIGEAAGEAHQVVGGDGTGYRNSHGSWPFSEVSTRMKVEQKFTLPPVAPVSAPEP